MKKHQHVAAHCKICSYSEHNLSWIDQLVVRGDSTLKNILMNLENCDGPLLEYFYGSAFERLDANASANILGLWIEAMGSEVWLGIMNTHSKEFPSHGLCPRLIISYLGWPLKIRRTFSIIYCAATTERSFLSKISSRHCALPVSKKVTEWGLKCVYSCVKLRCGES